ncbi:hypothetical protein EES41_08080 [Streptomyces sp. ADI95-16]|nr:hypothetical protein EES41_08080 [Streptomyces sp. ADI95-16]
MYPSRRRRGHPGRGRRIRSPRPGAMGAVSRADRAATTATLAGSRPGRTRCVRPGGGRHGAGPEPRPCRAGPDRPGTGPRPGHTRPPGARKAGTPPAGRAAPDSAWEALRKPRGPRTNPAGAGWPAAPVGHRDTRPDTGEGRYARQAPHEPGGTGPGLAGAATPGSRCGAARHRPRPPAARGRWVGLMAGSGSAGPTWPDRPEAGRIRAPPRVRGRRAKAGWRPRGRTSPGLMAASEPKAGWRPRGLTSPGPVATSEPRAGWRPRSRGRVAGSGPGRVGSG